MVKFLKINSLMLIQEIIPIKIGNKVEWIFEKKSRFLIQTVISTN